MQTTPITFYEQVFEKNQKALIISKWLLEKSLQKIEEQEIIITNLKHYSENENMFMEDLRSQVVENENKKQNYKNEILSLQNKISKYDHETKLRKSNLQTTFVDMLQIKAKVERQI